MMSTLTTPRRTEITDKLRTEINKVVSKYIESGVAELVPGVLFIDEVHMLDIECFTYLNRALESPISPIVVLASNRGVCSIRGTESSSDPIGIQAPHGIPTDLAGRLLIVPTYPYNEEDIRTIVRIRAKTEALEGSEEALGRIAQIGTETSLRYALQLLSPVSVLARSQGRQVFERGDVEEARELFIDAGRSAQLVDGRFLL